MIYFAVMAWDDAVARVLEWQPWPEIDVPEGGMFPRKVCARVRVLPWDYPNSGAPVIHYFFLRLPSYRWMEYDYGRSMCWHQLTLMWSSHSGWSFEWWAEKW